MFVWLQGVIVRSGHSQPCCCCCCILAPPRCAVVLCVVLQVYDPEVDQDRGFGLLGDSDQLWTPDKRERQKHQVTGCFLLCVCCCRLQSSISVRAE